MTNTMGIERIAYSVKEAAEAMGVSERTMWECVRRGIIPSFMLMGRRLISRDVLQKQFGATQEGGVAGIDRAPIKSR